MGNRDHRFSGASRPRAVRNGSIMATAGVRILYLSWAASAVLPALRVSRDTRDARDTFGRRNLLLCHGKRPPERHLCVLDANWVQNIDHFASCVSHGKTLVFCVWTPTRTLYAVGQKLQYVFFTKQPNLNTTGPICGVTGVLILKYTEMLTNGRLLPSMRPGSSSLFWEKRISSSGPSRKAFYFMV